MHEINLKTERKTQLVNITELVQAALTDANGAAAWGIRCSAEGADTLSLTIGTGVTAFKLPACGPGAPPPATTTTRAR